VQPQSNLDGKTREEVGLASPAGFQWESIMREGTRLLASREEGRQGGDVLTFIASAGALPGLAVIFIGTIVMTNVISNVARAAFMFPVALSVSEVLGVSFKPFVMVLMIAASCLRLRESSWIPD
jgi:hypothetical protein